MNELEQRAWLLYCEETAGGLDVRDFWEELPPYVQEIYLKKTAVPVAQPDRAASS